MEIINITKESKSYEHIDSLIIIVAALATAIEYRNCGVAKYNLGDYIVVEGNSTNKMIRFPLFGPLEAALVNKKLDLIEIIIQDIEPSPNKYDKTIDVLNKTMEYIFLPLLLDFYERYRNLAELKFGKYKSSPEAWSDSWQMAWVVRNAIAHNHKIDFIEKNPKPKTWSGITISKEDQGKPLDFFFNFADLIILLFEMEKDLE